MQITTKKNISINQTVAEKLDSKPLYSYMHMFTSPAVD